MKNFLTMIILIITISASAQSHCQRQTIFTADFSMQTNTGFNRVNATLNIGSNGLSNVNDRYRNWGGTIGSKMYDEMVTDKNSRINFETRLTPVATSYINYRFNGEYSALVHTFMITAGINKYFEYSYRVCSNPGGNSFATVGFTASYSTKQGITAGVVIIGLF